MKIGDYRNGKIIMIKYLFICACMFAFATTAFAWGGYDYEAGNYVEVEKGNLVREGEEIEIYDYGAGEYRDVTVESIDDTGSSVELEVYDSDASEYRTFEMEK